MLTNISPSSPSLSTAERSEQWRRQQEEVLRAEAAAREELAARLSRELSAAVDSAEKRISAGTGWQCLAC